MVRFASTFFPLMILILIDAYRIVSHLKSVKGCSALLQVVYANWPLAAASSTKPGWYNSVA
jgi:hypothetical protein